MAEEFKTKIAGAGGLRTSNDDINAQKAVLEAFINKNNIRFEQIAKLGKQQSEEISNLRENLLKTNRLVEEDLTDIYRKCRGLSKRIRREARFRKTAQCWKRILKSRSRIIIQNMESFKESQVKLFQGMKSLTESQECLAKSLESLAKSQESIAKSQESLIKSQESLAKSQENMLTELQQIGRNVGFLMQNHDQAAFK